MAIIIGLAAAILAGFALWPSIPSYLSTIILGGNQTAPPVKPPVGNDTGNPTEPGPQPDSTLTIVSSPSAFPFADRWIAQYKNEKGERAVQMSYSGEAETLSHRSSSDIDEFLLKSSIDVVITGNVPEWNSTFDNGTAVLPVAPQAVAIVYNVPGFPDLSTGLKLDPPTLSAILDGNVSFWDDSRIAELNPDITLPHERIEVIHSPSEQSTSRILDEYLSAANETATWWNTTVPLDDPSDVAAAVRRTPYSIAYVEYSYATQTRMTFAAIQNYDGDFVVPSSHSIGMAVMNGTVFGDLEQLDNNTLQSRSSFPAPQIAAGKLGNGSYPVTSFYYALFQSEDPQDIRMNSTVLNQTESKANSVTEEFIRWIASERGQSILKQVGYPSIYESSDELGLYRDRLFD